MRGVLLAGGAGSRLSPLTRVTNKHLLPVGNEPMIFHPLRRLIEMGIRDIMVVTGTDHAGDVFRLLGSGREFSARFVFRVQDEAGGIAQALALAEDFVEAEPFSVILGDNVFTASLVSHARRFLEYAGSRPVWDARGMVLLHEVEHPERFGVATFAGDQLVEIVEKPVAPASRLAVTGCYFYAGAELFEIIRSIEPSARGELEISNVNQTLLSRGRLTWGRIDGEWTDAGTHESLRRANELIWSQL